jgi:hypothetical protein
MYEITKLTDKELRFKENERIPDHMMKLPFRLLVCAPSHSGKTLVVSNLLVNPSFGYKQGFGSNIFWMSPTASLGDPSMHGVDIPEQNMFNEYRPDVLNEILDDQEKLIARYGKESGKVPHVLVVLDDLVTSIPTRRQNELVNIFLSGRHRLVSIMVCTQVLRLVPSAIRLNASHFITFKVNNLERGKMAEEQSIDIDDFTRLYKEATKEPYSFLYVNLTKIVKERYYKRFETLLTVEEKTDE